MFLSTDYRAWTLLLELLTTYLGMPWLILPHPSKQFVEFSQPCIQVEPGIGIISGWNNYSSTA